MKLTFVGATDEVTGSMTLVQTPAGKILIDCGMHQGSFESVQKNLNPLPFDPRDIKAIFLTHAHLDHSGSIPHLVKLGFRGSIFCTRATMKLALLIMADSAHIIEETENHPLKNYYGVEEVVKTTSFFVVKEMGSTFSFLDLKVSMLPAGHILGAVSYLFEDEDKKRVVFSGDLGRHDDPLNSPPPPCPKADVVVLESTYGGKLRKGDLQKDLTDFLKLVKRESKVGIIASFAVSRAQLLITLIHQYNFEHPEDKVRFVIDGPMMSGANRIYQQFTELTEMAEELRHALGDVEVIDNIREWHSIQKQKGPIVIISSSGMITGGRIWRYLENWQDDKNAVLFLPGYQAANTAGRKLSEGVREVKNEEGKIIHWSGSVISSQAFSSHADQDELIEWISELDKSTHIYLNHGDPDAKVALRKKLKSLGFEKCDIAQAERLE